MSKVFRRYESDEGMQESHFQVRFVQTKRKILISVSRLLRPVPVATSLSHHSRLSLSNFTPFPRPFATRYPTILRISLNALSSKLLDVFVAVFLVMIVLAKIGITIGRFYTIARNSLFYFKLPKSFDPRF